MSGHTPGPWGVEDPMDHCLTIVANPSDPVCDWKWVATVDWPDEDNQLLTSSEQKANARLIAAAPELLEALQEIHDYVWKVRDPSPSTVMDVASRAIAKSTGEAQ